MSLAGRRAVALFVVVILAYAVFFLFEAFAPDLFGLSYTWVVVLWVFANLLDLHSTLLGVGLLGSEHEANPIVRVVMKVFGPITGLIGFKVIFVPIFAVLFRDSPIVLVTWTIVIFLVSIQNYVGYRRYTRG